MSDNVQQTQQTTMPPTPRVAPQVPQQKPTATVAAKQKYPTKTFHAAHPNYRMCLDNDQNPDETIIVGAGVISFSPETEKLTGLIFGRFNTGDPNTLLRFNVKEVESGKTRKITPPELAALIENSKSYQDCAAQNTMGVRGIWDKDKREAWLKTEAGAKDADPANVYDRLSDTLLKSNLEENKVSYPADADHKTLVDLNVQLFKR